MNNERLVELGDLDELVRQVDRLADAGDWHGLLDLRDRCRRALERGRQLWPAASLAEYRLALDAPGKWAASVLVPDAGRFALGPLSEVAASTHTWAELAPHVPATPGASLAGHERVVRGEDLSRDRRFDPSALELLSPALQEWEPSYPVAEYKADGADFGSPPHVDRWQEVSSGPALAIDDNEVRRALLDLAQSWTSESNGRAEAVAVDGDAPGAIAVLGVSKGRIARVDAAHALAAMAWAAASGGAHGRRRGMAAGRFGAWWVLTTLAGLTEEAGPQPTELGAVANLLRWYRWDAGEPETGWSLRLAVEDTHRGRAWAVSAVDAAL
jgi:hypothetical protein